MSSSGRKATVVAAAVSAVVLAAAAFAWACTEQAAIFNDPQSGPPGTEVEVVGEGFTDDVVELRWETAAGPLLGTAQGPSFRKTVTIPAADMGEHTIVAYHVDPMHTDEHGRPDPTFGMPSAAFYVTPAAAPKKEPARGGAPAPKKDAGRHQPAPAPADALAEERATNHGGRQVFAGSVAKPGAGLADSTVTGQRRSAPVESAFSDPATAFETGTGGSLVAGPTGALPSETNDGAVALGMALLGLGVVALSGGGLIAALRRRRAAVETRSS